MEDTRRSDERPPEHGPRRGVWRFTGLLVTIGVMLLWAPLLPLERYHVAPSRIIFSGILLASLYAVSGRRSDFLVGLTLAVPILVTDWVAHFQTSPLLLVSNLLLSGIFWVFLIVVVLREILREDRVSADTILGAVCVYLVLALVWVNVYSSIELVHPGSFLVRGTPVHQLYPDTIEHRFNELIYFSYVTMTTLGYGDITPRSGPAQSMAALQAMVGQLYVAIFVARLVALQLVDRRSGDDPSRR